VSAVHELLDRLTELGATVRPEGDRLILRAGARPVPAELVRRLRRAKPEVLAALATAAAEARCWRERFTARTFAWAAARKRAWRDAQRLAWSDLQNEWHALHGRRWPASQCAGCEQPISGRPTVDLPDGNRVHLEPVGCLIKFGHRWRGEADAALAALGLNSPADAQSSAWPEQR